MSRQQTTNATPKTDYQQNIKEGYIGEYKGKIIGWRKKYLVINNETLRLYKSQTEYLNTSHSQNNTENNTTLSTNNTNSKYQISLNTGEYSVSKTVEMNSKRHNRPYLQIYNLTTMNSKHSFIEISSLSDEITELEEWKNFILQIQLNAKKTRRFAVNNNVKTTLHRNNHQTRNHHPSPPPSSSSSSSSHSTLSSTKLKANPDYRLSSVFVSSSLLLLIIIIAIIMIIIIIFSYKEWI